MKILTILSICLMWMGCLSAQQNLSALVPMPNYIETQEGKAFVVTEKTQIVITDASLQFEAEELQRVFKAQMGLKLNIQTGGVKGKHIYLKAEGQNESLEHYQLQVQPKRIEISAESSKGVFYGIQTLAQLLLGDAENTAHNRIAPVVLEDSPRFAFRGFMLDVARHFLPVSDVKRFIDLMVRYKYNVLQLHLTDDQGWRIEIKKYPQLTKVGAFRDEKGGDQGPDNGFYTQEQLKDIIDYAAERHVEIIPELDIPGHTAAVLAVFPEMLCQRPDTVEVKIGKTTDVMMCASNECGYEIYRDILTEVAALFPSPSIHLGGDEAVIEKNWEKCSSCQTLKEKLGYQKSSDLMNHFFGKILTTVRELKKEPILWCELNNLWMPADSYLFNYPKDVTLVSWRAGLTPLCHELTQKSGNPLIMAPGEYAYLDYPQYKGDLPEYNNWGMPITTLEKTYEFDPAYGGKFGEKHIKGVLGTLWSEAIKDFNRVTYMAYPRGLALAEVAWTQMEHRTWDSFKQRICPNLYQMMKDGISFRVPFEIFSSYVCN